MKEGVNITFNISFPIKYFSMKLEASWEAWRRAEGGLEAREPTIRVGLEVDRVTFDLRPDDLTTLNRIREAIDEVLKKKQVSPSRV